MSRSRAPVIGRNSLDGLGVLNAVVKAGSFVRAGEALGLTQSAVSRAIARLEHRVGVRLFRRTARSISMTDEGARFYESGRASSRCHRRSDRRGGRRFGASAGPIAGQRRSGHRAVRPDPASAGLSRRASGSFGRDLRSGQDGRSGARGVRCGDPVRRAGTVVVEARLLLRTRVLTCASPEYLARRGTPSRPTDIESHQCVMMRNPATGSPFEWEFVRGKRRCQ